MSEAATLPKDARGILTTAGPQALRAAVMDVQPVEPPPASNSKPKESLRERAYALRFDPAVQPPPDESCMSIDSIPIAARGNLTVIQGKSKVGKSAVVSAILGAVHRGEVEAFLFPEPR